MRSARRGFTLVEILIATALMGILATLFFTFSKNASKSASNVVKVAENAGIDANIRAILANRNSCLETAKAIASFATTTEQRPAAIYSWLANGNVQKTYEENGLYGSIKILELGVTVGADDRNMRLLHFRVKTEKQGESLNRTQYEQHYYVNLLTTAAGVPMRCVMEEGQGKLTLEMADDVKLLATATQPQPPAGRIATSAPNGSTTYGLPGWEYHNLQPATAAANCAIDDPTNLCPQHRGPTYQFTAQGNVLVYSFQTKISSGIDPANPCSPLAFGGIVGVELKDSNGQLVRPISSTLIAGWYQQPGFNQNSVTIPTVYADVTPGDQYTLGLVFARGEQTPSGGYYFLHFFPATGTVYHYTKNSPSP